MRFGFTRGDLPDGFVFGAATAAYQIEGTDGAGPSHWDSWSATPGNVATGAGPKGGPGGAVACDHQNRREEDLDLVAAGGFDAYRFSTSWARIIPDGRTPSTEGLDFYDRLVDGMVARGLAPWLTLYHWDLPSPLADIGGWANRETAERFGEFTGAVMDRIGDRVRSAATINEPWCVAWLSHFLGGQAPGLRDVRAAMRAMHYVMLAHGRGLSALRDAGCDRAGIVLNLAHIEAAGALEADKAAATRMDAIQNRWFTDALFRGTYPEDMLDAVGEHVPQGWEDDMSAIAAPIDWLGLNYYTRTLAADLPGALWPSFASPEGPLPKTQMGWEIFPEGLEALLHRIAGWTDRPIIITENGMAWDDTLDEGACNDPERVAYFDDHIAAVRRAIAGGVPVEGYFAWSLLDNFEWSFGYEKRFGIVHVDYATQARTPKASHAAFRAALTDQG